MGCSPFSGRSSSSYDSNSCTCKGCKTYTDTAMAEVLNKKSPNPDPKNCTITHAYQLHNYLVVGITYPDCTTFEGKKVLVYKDCSLEKLHRQIQIAGIDPHFAANKMYYSPIARFIPTKEGWQMAKDFVKVLWDIECGAPRNMSKYNTYGENK